MERTTNTSAAALRDLYPGVSEPELEAAQMVLRSFVEVAATIYRNALRDPERRVVLERLLTESEKESRIRIDQGREKEPVPQGE